MKNSAQIFGQRAEAAAVEFLLSRGYTLVEQNFTTRYGEIDIVARHEDTLVFIEVKARRGIRHGNPREAVNASKQHKIIAVATYYLRQHHIHDTRIRFDVVAMVEQKGKFVFELIPNAFQGV